jgi:hypothetical protein
MTSATDGDPSDAMRSALLAAPTKRDAVMISSFMCLAAEAGLPRTIEQPLD